MRQFYFAVFFACISYSANTQIITFNDPNFKAKLLSSTYNNNSAYYLIAADQNEVDMVIDTNGNGEIEVSEAQGVYYLNIQGVNAAPNPTDLVDLTGIEHFTNLIELNCADNLLTSLDVSALVNLKYFRCDRNNLSSLNLGNISTLRTIAYGSNNLPNFSVENNPLITELMLDSTGSTFVDTSEFPNLEWLVCSNNQIQSLDLSQNTKMRALFCDHNQLTFLDISNYKNFDALHANDNPFLQDVIMKLGKVFDYQDMNPGNMNFTNCPNLRYICVDDYNVTNVEEKMADDYDYPNCHVNSYCTFEPGGVYHLLSGTSRLNQTGNDCNPSDPAVPNVKYTVVTGTNSVSYFANNSGNFFIPLVAGSHTVTPEAEIPGYFSAQPGSLSVTLSVGNSPVYQDFCLIPQGIHPDLEVNIIPVSPARPGFDSTYEIAYKNNGNVTLSGSIQFSFEDQKMDFVSASPIFESQTEGQLNWNYTNLAPFERRSITVILNINSPMESPAVNGGDQLDFSAVITPIEDDELPFDNDHGIKQTVVNSFDPNDKTCLQGNTVGPEMIGEYVHYLIRFENTGTFAAQNIVVKDMIDLSKFDISTLVPLHASHPFETRISQGNKVEFIFENILLPFDDANNDGYVAFKIKTLPSLVIGDTFSNTANIYFDYNFPIVTNTASTIIQALNASDFHFDNHFTIYPNPAQDVLTIGLSGNIAPKSAAIYNMLGQLVIASTNWNPAIDISALNSGTYLVRIESDKGVSAKTFIKK